MLVPLKLLRESLRCSVHGIYPSAKPVSARNDEVFVVVFFFFYQVWFATNKILTFSRMRVMFYVLCTTRTKKLSFSFFVLAFFSLDILSRKIKELFSINSARARRDFSVWCCSSHNVKFRI